MEVDVLVVGAGVAGLSAAFALEKQGLSIVIVDARNRVGGRVLTLLDPEGSEPIELGAEFVHGLPAETLHWLDPIEDLMQRTGDSLVFQNGKLRKYPFYFKTLSRILTQLSGSLGQDLSFSEWINQSPPLGTPEVLSWVTGYIQGYHAANTQEVSVEALKLIEKETIEYNAVEGSLFLRRGQGSFTQRLRNSLSCPILLRHCVKSIQWSEHGAIISFASDSQKAIRAKKVVLTVPLGVLQMNPSTEGGIHFHPELPENLQRSLSYFKMGSAVKITYLIEKSFFSEVIPDLNFSMILDPTPGTPVRAWWKRGETHLTAWNAGPPEELPKDLSATARRSIGIHHLSKLFAQPTSTIEKHLGASYFHNWSTDPFSGGAYPYIKVGGNTAQEHLSQPVQNVLYFAGDATCKGGFFSTVNGALKSGLRVAQQILTGPSNHIAMRK